MALSRKQKEQIVADYGEKLSRSQVLIWSRFSHINVADMTSLRRNLQGAGAEGVVVKNTLLRIALQQAELPVDMELTEQASLVTFIYDDIAPAAKAVSDFSRSHGENFTPVGGIVGNSIVDASGVQALTTLPNREQLLAQVVGGIQAPITGFVSVLAAVMRGFVTVLDGRREQLVEQAG